MRGLIHAPIIHDDSLNYLIYEEIERIPQETLLAVLRNEPGLIVPTSKAILHEAYGKYFLPHYYKFINERIRSLRERVRDRHIDKVYLDGLVDTPSVRNHFMAGKRETQLYRAADLWIKAGSQLAKTEHRNLLRLHSEMLDLPREEAEQVQGSKEALVEFASEKIPSKGFPTYLKGLIERTGTCDPMRLRDHFIADSIDASLREGETGLLYLGKDHCFREVMLTGNKSRSSKIGILTLEAHEDAASYALKEMQKKRLVTSPAIIEIMERYVLRSSTR